LSKIWCIYFACVLRGNRLRTGVFVERLFKRLKTVVIGCERSQWAKLPKKQSEGVRFFMTNWPLRVDLYCSVVLEYNRAVNLIPLVLARNSKLGSKFCPNLRVRNGALY